MSNHIEVIDVEPGEEQGLSLSSREYEFVSRVHRICLWLAKETEDETIQRCIDELGMTEPTAKKWIAKAEDYMALGIVENIDISREMYNYRLEQIFNLCMSNAQRDMVEVTTKPWKLRVAGQNDENQDRFEVITATQTKVKANALDVGAIQTALKAAEKAARLAGVKVGKVGGGAKIGTVNVQINQGELPGAQSIGEMSNEQLAGLAGLEVAELVEVVSSQHDPAGDPAVSDVGESAETADTDAEEA